MYDETKQFNYIKPGELNNINLYCLAKSWVRPRFINTNPDPNNVDVFEYRGGIGTLVQHEMGPYLHGNTDSLFSNALFKTWSGTYKYGVHSPGWAHTVDARLTRNGVTRDTSIIYTVPPFDTTLVEIWY